MFVFLLLSFLKCGLNENKISLSDILNNTKGIAIFYLHCIVPVIDFYHHFNIVLYKCAKVPTVVIQFLLPVTYCAPFHILELNSSHKASLISCFGGNGVIQRTTLLSSVFLKTRYFHRVLSLIYQWPGFNGLSTLGVQ